MEITLARIEAAEADVARLEAEEARMRKAAEADGTIDPREQADLDRILGKIRQGRDLVTRLRADDEANKAVWDGTAGDLATLKAQTRELADWGEPAAAGLASGTQACEAQAAGEQWKAATAALQKLQDDILAPYADYQRQKAAKELYDPARAAFDTRLATASATDLRTAEVTRGLESIAGAGAAMDLRTAARDYVTAQETLTQATGQLDQVEAAITEAGRARDAYRSARGDLDARLAGLGDAAFKALKDRRAALDARVAETDARAVAFDFAGAGAEARAAAAEAEALQLEAETLRLARDGYQALRQGLDARIADARGQPGADELAPKLDPIESRVKATQTAFDAEDFAAATAGLEEAAWEMGGFEQLLADRKLYLERLETVMPQIVEHGVSTEHNGFLSEHLGRLADTQTKMETAARALDFTAALAALDEIVIIIGEIEAAIAAKRQEYQTERGIEGDRLALLAAKPYPEITARVFALDADLATADSDAAADHFDTAMDDLAAIATEIDLLEQDVAAIEKALKEKIARALEPVKTKLPEIAEPPSPGLEALKALVTSAEGRIASLDDLPKGVTEAEEAAKRLAELVKVHEIMKRVEAKWGINQDDEAREIVKQLKASGDLNGLPMEARNDLVEKLMSGIVTKDDHAAIQDIWNQRKFVDRKYDELDAPKRKQIVEAFKNDPKVKDYQARWASMTDDEKKEAVRDMTTIPCGKDGWNVGDPANFEFTDEPKMRPKKGGKSGEMEENPKFLYGSYNAGSDKMMVNLHRDATHADLIELMDTIAHEIGHKEQAALIKGYKDGSIPPGDPRYDQAKALKLCEDYRNDH